MKQVIDWSIIAKIIEFHTDKVGRTYIEVPWLVSDEALMITHPKDKAVATQLGFYTNIVGSAEQSFIQMMIDDKLNAGQYITASPCFRNDPEDKLHQRHFFKIELINVLPAEPGSGRRHSTESEVQFMALRALDGLYEVTHYSEHDRFGIVRTHEGLDITLNGIEVGSYGYRTAVLGGCPRHWIYGTAIAEPRYSIARDSFF